MTFSASFYRLHRRSEFSGKPEFFGLPESREAETVVATPEGRSPFHPLSYSRSHFLSCATVTRNIIMRNIRARKLEYFRPGALLHTVRVVSRRTAPRIVDGSPTTCAK